MSLFNGVDPIPVYHDTWRPINYLIDIDGRRRDYSIIREESLDYKNGGRVFEYRIIEVDVYV